MSIVLGLDVSTSCTGLCILDSSVVIDDKGTHIIKLEHIDFKKCVTLFDKADKVSARLAEIKNLHPNIDKLAIEEPLMGFSKGMSSASTITTLMRFNGIVSYIARQRFKIDPEYISASHARKVCGMKMQKFSVCKKTQKDQVFDYMHTHDLKHVQWPNKKKSTNVVDWAKDETDSYVIARAWCVMNT